MSGWNMFRLAIASLMIGFAGTAMADEKDAETCLKDKIWSGYSDGWAVRTATTTTLKQDEHRVYLLTLYAGNEYNIRICADKGSKNVDLILHDLDGKELLRDTDESREPTLLYKPAETQTFYVAVYATELSQDSAETGVALAVTYR